MSTESPHFKEGFNDRVDGLEHGKWFQGNVQNPNDPRIQINVGHTHPAAKWTDEQKRDYVAGYKAADAAIKDYLRIIRKS